MINPSVNSGPRSDVDGDVVFVWGKDRPELCRGMSIGVYGTSLGIVYPSPELQSPSDV